MGRGESFGENAPLDSRRVGDMYRSGRAEFTGTPPCERRWWRWVVAVSEEE